MAGAEVDGLVATVAARQHGAFTLAQARQAGLTRAGIRHRLDSQRWVPLCKDVYRLAGAPVTWELRLFAAVAGAGPGAAASHRAAAQLFRIPGFTGNWVEVTGRRGIRPPFSQVRVHSRPLLPHHVKQIGPIATTSVARTLFDLATVVKAQQLERALDNCLVRNLVTPAAAWSIYHEAGGRGRPGSQIFRHLLAARGEGFVAPASELERLFIDGVIIEGGFPMPDREVDLGDADGWIGRVEFVHFLAKLLIEVDGRLYHTAHLDRRRDRRRGNRFTAAGWRTLHLDYEMLTQELPYCRKLVGDALAAAA